MTAESFIGAFAVPDAMMARAWILAADGAPRDAIALAGTIADLTAGQVPHLAADALGITVRLGDTSAAERLTGLEAAFDSDLLRAYVADGAGRAHEDAAAVEAASLTFEALGTDLLAAEATVAAARLHRAQGRRASALACEESARRLLAACGDPVSPALSGPSTDEAPLTPREREIALLIAGGLTSRAVAERLHLSVRTVETHLGRVYDKLGINRRGQLVEAFGGTPLRRPTRRTRSSIPIRDQETHVPSQWG